MAVTMYQRFRPRFLSRPMLGRTIVSSVPIPLSGKTWDCNSHCYLHNPYSRRSSHRLRGHLRLSIRA